MSKETQEFLTEVKKFSTEFKDGAEDGKLSISEILGLGDNVYKIYIESKDMDLIIQEVSGGDMTPEEMGTALITAIDTIKNMITGIKSLI